MIINDNRRPINGSMTDSVGDFNTEKTQRSLSLKFNRLFIYSNTLKKNKIIPL